MAQTPRIRVDKVEDIRILVCHLIYALGCPLTRNQLIEITSFEDAVNYFDITAALDSAANKLCSVEEINGEPVYSNTELGIKAAREFENVIPASIREKMFDEAVRVYTRDAIKEESPITVRYAQNLNGTCTVGVSARDVVSGKQRFYFTMQVESSERAEQVKDKINADPNKLVRYIESYFE